MQKLTRIAVILSIVISANAYAEDLSGQEAPDPLNPVVGPAQAGCSDFSPSMAAWQEFSQPGKEPTSGKLTCCNAAGTCIQANCSVYHDPDSQAQMTGTFPNCSVAAVTTPAPQAPQGATAANSAPSSAWQILD